MRYVWDMESATYIDNMVHNFKGGITQAILWTMVFAEEKSKAIFIQGQNADMMPPNPPALPPPGPLVSRTGRLRASIKATAGKDSGWIGTTVPYGVCHEATGINEFGTKIGKRPFLSPSFEGRNWAKIEEIIVDEVIREMTK